MSHSWGPLGLFLLGAANSCDKAAGGSLSCRSPGQKAHRLMAGSGHLAKVQALALRHGQWGARHTLRGLFRSWNRSAHPCLGVCVGVSREGLLAASVPCLAVLICCVLCAPGAAASIRGNEGSLPCATNDPCVSLRFGGGLGLPAAPAMPC